MDRTLQDFEDTLIASNVVSRISSLEVAATQTFDENKFRLRFESIEEALKEMQSALGKYIKDPGRMKPQLDNLSDAARRIAQDIRTIQRLLEPLQK
jgi:uncharacterized protein YabN with tetrapyrrole methylase and pyrophosphatase domain